MFLPHCSNDDDNVGSLWTKTSWNTPSLPSRRPTTLSSRWCWTKRTAPPLLERFRCWRQWVWQLTKSVSIPAEEQNAGRVVDYFYRMEFHITPRFFSDSNYLFFISSRPSPEISKSAVSGCFTGPNPHRSQKTLFLPDFARISPGLGTPQIIQRKPQK